MQLTIPSIGRAPKTRLSIFPEFSSLGIEHYKEVRDIADKFAPYSDFNFTSLFSWNVDSSTQVASLNGNLVVSMSDYLSGDRIYTMLGNKRVDESINQLLELVDNLKLVPEAVIRSIKHPERFNIMEDIDNHDYIYSLKDMATLSGGAYKSKRKMIHRFQDRYADKYEIRNIDFSNPATQERILATFALWAADRGRSHDDISNEHQAISRLLENSDKLKLWGLEIFINDKAVGFSIHEILDKAYTICHFHKTVLEYIGIDTALTIYAAQELNREGFKFENWEQDLGIAGLRELKSSYNPSNMLKKYQIRKAQV